MKLNWKIFKSNVPQAGSHAPRFANHEVIQLHLEQICKAWAKYLQQYVQRTGEKELFGKPELPWMNTERAIVSSLSSSIIRKYPDSIVLEESRVPKPGRSQDVLAKKARDWGRCDLWVAIGKDKTGPFNFYLEAKVSPHNWNTANLKEHLSSYGLSKIFRDYMKSHPATLAQRSPYRKQRKHEHYIIGMYLTRLEFKKEEVSDVKETLQEIFGKIQRLDVGGNANNSDRIIKQRQMARYPTVALILNDESGINPGFVASFTVLGATKKLTTQNRHSEPKRTSKEVA